MVYPSCCFQLLKNISESLIFLNATTPYTKNSVYYKVGNIDKYKESWFIKQIGALFSKG